MQPLKKQRKIFESCEKWWDNLKSSSRKLMSLIQIRKPRKPMNISILQSARSTLITFNALGDFMLSRATPLQGYEVAHLQSPGTSLELSLWPVLQDPALLLPYPSIRIQNMVSRALPPALMITVLSTKA
jgi:hypothetical protein